MRSLLKKIARMLGFQSCIVDTVRHEDLIRTIAARSRAGWTIEKIDGIDDNPRFRPNATCQITWVKE